MISSKSLFLILLFYSFQNKQTKKSKTLFPKGTNQRNDNLIKIKNQNKIYLVWIHQNPTNRKISCYFSHTTGWVFGDHKFYQPKLSNQHESINQIWLAQNSKKLVRSITFKRPMFIHNLNIFFS